MSRYLASPHEITRLRRSPDSLVWNKSRRKRSSFKRKDELERADFGCGFGVIQFILRLCRLDVVSDSPPQPDRLRDCLFGGFGGDLDVSEENAVGKHPVLESAKAAAAFSAGVPAGLFDSGGAGFSRRSASCAKQL